MRGTSTSRKSPTNLYEWISHASVQFAVAVLSRLVFLFKWIPVNIIEGLLWQVVAVFHVHRKRVCKVTFKAKDLLAQVPGKRLFLALNVVALEARAFNFCLVLKRYLELADSLVVHERISTIHELN